MNDYHDMFEVAWQGIIDWFAAQPIYGQILILVGVIAILVLAVVIVYYVLKGVAYLVYYILKGVYYLFKGIGLLIYKIFEALYYGISGESKPNTIQQQNQPQLREQIIQKAPIQKNSREVHAEVTFCSECGKKFSGSMIQTLSENDVVYCIHCGKGFQANPIIVEV